MKAVAGCGEKALVLVARNAGLEVLLAHLRSLSPAAGEPGAFGVATIEDLAAFNADSNLLGERFRVLVADATQCSEGVSFLAVRRVHLADVPASPGALVQAVGRATRMHGHRGLPEGEQTVTTRIYVAALPRWLRSSLGAWALRTQKQRKNPKDTEAGAKRLLRRLAKVGVRRLEDLKARLDEHLKAQQAPAGTPAEPPAAPDAAGCASLLEHLGLWDEALAM